jgi:exonuclease VII small subunit
MKELQRGERTAAALENHLDSLEKKIEELLAQADKAEQELQTPPRGSSEKTPPEEGKRAS